MAEIYLVKDIAEVKQYVGTNFDTSYEVIFPYLQTSKSFLIPITGIPQYDALCTIVSPNDQREVDFINSAKKAVVNYAFYLASFDMILNISDSGITRMEGDMQKSPYQWQMKQFRHQRLTIAYQGIQELLFYFNYYNKLNDSWAALWYASPEHDKQKSLFLLHDKEFSEYRLIDGFDTFISLKAAMKHVQDQIISANIGEELYNEMVAAYVLENASNPLSTDQLALLPKLQKATALWTIWKACDELTMRLSATGIRIQEDLDTNGNFETIKAGTEKANKALKIDAYDKAVLATQELRTFLDKNASADKYPTYFNSDLYTAPDDTTKAKVFMSAEDSPTFFSGF